MATTTPPDLLALPDDLLATPAARRALQSGLLAAKRSALASAERLARAGWPLLIAIISVSFLHIWDVIALIRPEYVQELQLHHGLYHFTAAAQTLAIDAAALYCVAAAALAGHAGGGDTRRWGIAFFLILTFALNAAYIVRHAPSIDPQLQAAVLPVLDLIFALTLPAFIPIAIVSVERGRAELERCRLLLLVETTALAALLDQAVVDQPAALAAPQPESPVKALQSIPGPVRSPGRPALELGELLKQAPAGSTVTRAGVMELLDCGSSTADRLIAEGIDAGQLERIARGQYRRL